MFFFLILHTSTFTDFRTVKDFFLLACTCTTGTVRSNLYYTTGRRSIFLLRPFIHKSVYHPLEQVITFAHLQIGQVIYFSL